MLCDVSEKLIKNYMDKIKREKFLFGDIVVIEGNEIGVVVKTWHNLDKGYSYEVYVREYNKISDFKEKDIERYRVRHKYLNKEELIYQNG